MDRTALTPTVDFDGSLEFVELRGYKYHVRTFGDKARPPLIVVHGVWNTMAIWAVYSS